MMPAHRSPSRWLTGLLLALLGAAALAGCTLGSREEGTPDSPRAEAAVRAELSVWMDEVRVAQEVAAALWDRLIFGEALGCDETIPALGPLELPAAEVTAYPRAATIVALLDAAARRVTNAADLWRIECGTERETVPLEMARDGRANAAAAGSLLDEAARRLDAWAAGVPERNTVQ